MQLVLYDGSIKEVKLNGVFNNQYITTDGTRIYDTQVKHIIDDIRLGEYYTCSEKTGTYEEVAQAIAEERSKINKCNECWWYNNLTRIKDEYSKVETKKDGKLIVEEKTVYDVSCSWTKNHEKCVHDIEEEPKLFREAQFCFFCEYPQGVPDMKPLKRFMSAHANRYNLVPYAGDETLKNFKHNKEFGSYVFCSNDYNNYFMLRNARNHFEFYVDCTNGKFILKDGYSYRVVKHLTESKYNYTTHQYEEKPIASYDKFIKWFETIINDYMEEVNKNAL